MREIKFRVWNDNSDGMVYPNNGIGIFNMTLDGQSLIDGGSEGYSVDEEAILLQYTGLKDKNGVEIYESDRIAEYDGVIIYDVGSFWVDHIRGEGRMKTLLNEWINKRNKAGVGTEVTGNIHE